MRRVLLLLVAALALVPAAAVAHRGGEGGDGFGPPGDDGVRVFRGTVVSVNTTDGTIVADVNGPPPPPRYGPEGRGPRPEGDGEGGEYGRPKPPRPEGEGGEGGEGPFLAQSAFRREQGGRWPTKRVTFKTDADTLLQRDRKDASLGDLQEGDLVTVVILVDEGTSREETLNTPAAIVSAYSRPAFYGFAGKVTAVDTAGGKLTVAVRKATGNGRRIMEGAASNEVTFTVGERTALIVDGDRGELSDLQSGDLAAIGIKAGKNATRDEVLATPASIVLAFTGERVTNTSASRLATRALKAAKKRR